MKKINIMPTALSKNTLLLLIVALIAVAALGGGLFLLKKTPLKVASGKYGNTVLARAYEMMYSSSGVVATSTLAGMASSSTVELQPPSTIRADIKLGDRGTETIYTSDAVYFRDDKGNWLKSANQNSYQGRLIPTMASLDKVAEREKDSSKFMKDADASCASETCTVYKEVKENKQTSKYFFSKTTHRLLKQEDYFDNRLSETITYDYKNVEIKVPTDAKAAPVASTTPSDTSNLPAELRESMPTATPSAVGTRSALPSLPPLPASASAR